MVNNQALLCQSRHVNYSDDAENKMTFGYLHRLSGCCLLRWLARWAETRLRQADHQCSFETSRFDDRNLAIGASGLPTGMVCWHHWGYWARLVPRLPVQSSIPSCSASWHACVPLYRSDNEKLVSDWLEKCTRAYQLAFPQAQVTFRFWVGRLTFWFCGVTQQSQFCLAC